MQLGDLQARIESLYGDRDRARGTPAAVAWLCEEVGELAQAVRKGTPEQQLHELGDVLAWVVTLANQLGLSMEVAMTRFTVGPGCPRCATLPCSCA